MSDKKIIWESSPKYEVQTGETGQLYRDETGRLCSDGKVSWTTVGFYGEDCRDKALDTARSLAETERYVRVIENE